MTAEMIAVAERMKAKGRKPSVIVGGGSDAMGALEPLGQMVERGLAIDDMAAAAGSAGTDAGLLDLCRRGHFEKGKRIVFLRMGRAIGLTGHTRALPHLCVRLAFLAA